MKLALVIAKSSDHFTVGDALTLAVMCAFVLAFFWLLMR